MMRYTGFAILIIILLAKNSNASSLFGLPSTPEDTPDMMSMIMAMLAGIQAPVDEFGNELKFDKLTSTWTDNCSSTENCEYGVDPGDFDTCAQCLLGPGETCDSWSGDCGDNMLCVFPGPMECRGKCVLKEEFNSRDLGESCSEFIGQCKEGLHCKYDEEAGFLLPMYGSLMADEGECVDEATFKSREEGESCGNNVGECLDGLVCRGSMFPWSPQFCVNADTDRTFSQFNPLMGIQDMFGPPDEIDIVLFDEESEDQAMVDVLDMIENILPDMGVDADSDDIEITFSDNDDSLDGKDVTGHVNVEVVVHPRKHSSKKIDDDVIVLDIESLEEVSMPDNEKEEFEGKDVSDDILVLDIETPKNVLKDDDKKFDFDVDDSVIVLDLMTPVDAENNEEIDVLEMLKDDLSAMKYEEKVFNVL